MSCCGKTTPPVEQTTYFEYVGRTSLVAVGPVTRARYYFPATGARAKVDLRDRRGLMGVPNLREIGSR